MLQYFLPFWWAAPKTDPDSPADLQRWKDVYERACWNMRACNEIQDPEILYDPNDPSPFCTTFHQGIKPHLNIAAVPQYLSEEDREKYFQQCAEHEITHYKICPFDVRTIASMVDAISKSLATTDIPEDHIPEYAATITNMFSDAVIDTWRRDGYGKDTNPQDVEWWRKEFVKYVKGNVRDGELSRSTRVFHQLYEEMWDADLGVDGLKVEEQDKVKARELERSLGTDYRDSNEWYRKVGEFARIIAPIMREDAKNRKPEDNQKGKPNQGQSGHGNRNSPPSIPSEGNSNQESGCTCSDKKQNPNKAGLPDDLRSVTGTLPQMNEGEKAAYASEALKRNENNYQGFKTVVQAAGIEEGEIRRYWYRTKAANLMEVKPTEHARGHPRRAYYGKWNIGDPIEDLDVIKSLAVSPHMIPGRTTVKEKTRTARRGYKRFTARPDLLIVRDSSISMGGVKYESANTGAFAALDLAGKHGVRVAAVDFSGGLFLDRYPSELYAEWTTNYRLAEDVFLAKEIPSGGTVLPSQMLTEILRKNRDSAYTVLITDAEISELQSQISQEALDFIHTATSQGNKLTLLHITPTPADNEFTRAIEENGGQIKTIRNPDDIFGTIIGSVSDAYEEPAAAKT